MIKPQTTKLDFMKKTISDAIKSLIETRDNEKVELTIGELRGVLLNCMTGTRRSYTEAACAVEQYIVSLKVKKYE